jgi:hypothetical protein
MLARQGCISYAQNSACGRAALPKRNVLRYKLHSARKLLIYNDLKLCHFSGHSRLSLADQGFGAASDKI